MALMIELYPNISSKHREYMNANFGGVIRSQKPGLFWLPSWVYNYWLYKYKVRIKGYRKISLILSEFDEIVEMMPSKLLGAILIYNYQFDFEKLKDIEKIEEQQLFVLQEMHHAVLNIAAALSWDSSKFIEAYQKTKDCIENDDIPDDFWNQRMF